MEFKSYASGSTGNLYTVKNKTGMIMIECGIRFDTIQRQLHFKVHQTDGCLISHSHLDHCRAHKELSTAGIDLYMTWESQHLLGAEGHRIHIIKHMTPFKIKDFTIIPFSAEHNVEGTVGFVIKDDLTDQKLFYLTDSYYCKYKFKGLNIIAVECNYSEDLLYQNIEKAGMDPNRGVQILSAHFSLKNLLEFFRANDLSDVKVIYLLHLSTKNADKEHIRKEVQKTTGKQIIIC